MSAPIILSLDIAARVLPSLVRQADCRRVAIDRRDDPTFPWEKLGDAIANEMMLLPSGIYLADGWKDERAWPRPSVESILCRGNSAVFPSIEAVPPEIAARVLAGMRKAQARRARLIRDGDDLARMLGVDIAMRERLQVWQIGATDCSRTARQERKRQRDNERRRAARRAAGAKPRSEYEAGSTAAQARHLGISPYALRKRISREKAKASADVTCVTARNIDSLADIPVTSGSLADSAPLSGGASLSLVGRPSRPEPATLEQEWPIMPVYVPRLALERRIRELGFATDTAHVENALHEFETRAAMSTGATLDAVMSCENLIVEAMLAIGHEPGFDDLAARERRFASAA